MLVAAVAVQTAPRWVPASVDAVRDLPGVGFGRMHAVEQRVLTWADALQGVDESAAGRVVRPPPDSTRALWPPAPLVVRLPPEPSLPEEGRWRPVASCAVGPALVSLQTTSLRVDPTRPDVPTELVALDLRAVELRLVVGTDDGGPGAPLSESGPVLAAFNGGFQRAHGSYGLAEGGHIFVPAQPGAATVGWTPDGDVWMGAWPPPDDFGPLEGFRQNLQLLQQAEAVTPELLVVDADGPHPIGHSPTRRSGVCLRRPFTLYYVWTHRGTAAALGDAMVAAGCDVGMHLDLNAYNTGFEVLDPAAAPPCSRKLTRRMADTSPGRYLARQARDYFVVVARSPDRARPSAAGPP